MPARFYNGVMPTMRMKDGICVFDEDAREVIYQVFPPITHVSAYSRNRETIKAAIKIRYPDRLPAQMLATREDFFIHGMTLITHAPVPYVRASMDDMPWNYTGAKRLKYLASLENLAGVSSALAKYSAFVKREILPGAPKAPRVITAHNPSANLLFYPCAHGFEQSLLSIMDTSDGRIPGGVVHHPGDGLRFFAKGLNFDARSRDIRAKMQPGWHCFSVDVSSFDNCIREGFFEGELDIFTTLDNMVSRDMFTDAFISSEHADYVHGDTMTMLPKCRKSGDLQTGSGNCLVMHYYCTKLRAYVS